MIQRPARSGGFSRRTFYGSAAINSSASRDAIGVAMKARTKSKPTCPACGHALTDAEMNDQNCDMWALAPNEERSDVMCPACGVMYYVQGGYRPEYTTALDEDDL